MKSEKIMYSTKIKVDNNEEPCIVVGNGPNIICGIGPFSFYIKYFENMGEDCTLISFDKHWVETREERDEKKKIVKKTGKEEIFSTLDELMEYYNKMIDAVRKIYNCEKVSVIGASVPGVLPTEYAKRYHEKIDQVYLICIPFSPVLSNFLISDEEFKKQSEIRYLRYKESKENYEKLKEDLKKGGSRSRALPTSNIVIITNENNEDEGYLSDNSDYIESVRPSVYQFFGNSDTKKLSELTKQLSQFFEHWETNAEDKIMNLRFRGYFFMNEKMFPDIDVMENIKFICEVKGISVNIFSGATDLLIPLSEVNKEKLKKIKGVNLVEFKGGHAPYIENKKAFFLIMENTLKIKNKKEDNLKDNNLKKRNSLTNNNKENNIEISDKKKDFTINDKENNIEVNNENNKKKRTSLKKN